MKICNKCSVEKDISLFYKHPKTKDGYDTKCKECAKSAVRSNYSLKVDQYRAYEKTRTHAPHRVKARKEYAKTPGGKLAGNMAKMKWGVEHPIQRGASWSVNNAVRDGKLFKPKSCSCCGKVSTRLEGHHDDYAFPLVVRWLCSKCHYDWHETNEPLNGDQ